MNPKIHAAPRCAAHSCNRIEISPSRRTALLWFGWLLALCCAIFHGVALPFLARLAICAAIVGICLPVSWSSVLVLGSKAVRRLDWSQSGGFTAYSGPTLTPSPAGLARGSFRLGNQVLVLRLSTGFGVRFVLIDVSVQDPVSFRRLCRYLKTHSRRPPPGSGPPS